MKKELKSLDSLCREAWVRSQCWYYPNSLRTENTDSFVDLAYEREELALELERVQRLSSFRLLPLYFVLAHNDAKSQKKAR